MLHKHVPMIFFYQTVQWYIFKTASSDACHHKSKTPYMMKATGSSSKYDYSITFRQPNIEF